MNHMNNSYAFMIHEIIEQMLSVKAGRRIYERLEALCDGEITPAKIDALSDDQICLSRRFDTIKR